MATRKRNQDEDPMERLARVEAELEKARPKTEQQTIEERILAELSRLGGKRVSDDSILRQGTRMILPATMTPKDAIDYLHEHIEAQETVTTFNRTFQYRPNDGAAAFERALKRVFGSAGIARPTWTFFGRQPPELRTIAIGFNQTLQVPQGRIQVPSIDGIVTVGHINSRTYGPLFYLQIDCPRKYKAEVEGLFQVVEDELKRHSIYRGQAIDGATEPNFLDLSGVDPTQVIYSDEVMTQLDANVWSPLKHTDVYRELDIPRKRAVLLEGTYGTGKTLAAYLTAQVAVHSGWTFIYCRPNTDDLGQVMGIAKLYQPAVVFFEDVDTIAGPTDSGGVDQVSRLLDMFDGIQAKGTEIMAVLTTNHKERIHRGMVRPGRLDAMIHIGSLDRGGVERMVRATIKPDMLHKDTDFDAVYKAMEGYLPAFVREATDRAVRYAVSRNGGVPRILETDDFVDAAVGLRPQYELMQGAKEGEKADTLAHAMRSALRPTIDEIVSDSPIVDLEGDHIFTLAPANGS